MAEVSLGKPAACDWVIEVGEGGLTLINSEGGRTACEDAAAIKKQMGRA